MRYKLGLFIKTLREQHGLSSKEAADKMDVTPSYLSLLENNRKPMTKKPMRRLQLLYGFNFDDIHEDELDRVYEGVSSTAENLTSAEFLMLATKVYEDKLAKEIAQKVD